MSGIKQHVELSDRLIDCTGEVRQVLSDNGLLLLSVDKYFEGRDQGDVQFLKHVLVVIDIDLPEGNFWVSVLQGLKVRCDALARVTSIVLEVKNYRSAFRLFNDVIKSCFRIQLLHSGRVDGSGLWNLNSWTIWLRLGWYHNFGDLFLFFITAWIKAALSGLGD